MRRPGAAIPRVARWGVSLATWLLVALALGAARAEANPVISFKDDALVPHTINFGTLLVSAGSLLDQGRGIIILEETDVFDFAEDIDAAHLRRDGKIIISTVTSSWIDGTPFGPGDLILYDPDSGAATKFFDEGNFADAANVDAFYLFEEGPNEGKLLLSTAAVASLGGLVDFQPGDLVLYDPVTDTATLFFSQELVTGTAYQRDIDAVHVRSGRLILSFLVSGGALGGLALEPQDLVAYDRRTGTATVFLDGDGLFNGVTARLDAVTFAFPRLPALPSVGLGVLAIALAAVGVGWAAPQR
jgi:hypothetical protein